MWRHGERGDLFSGFPIPNQTRATLLNFLNAQHTLDRQVEDPRVFEFFPHFFFGRINDQTFGRIKYQAGNFDEPPQTAGGDAFTEQLVNLAIIQKDDFIKSFFRHTVHLTRFWRYTLIWASALAINAKLKPSAKPAR